METPARFTFAPDGSTTVFQIPVRMKGDNYVRIDIDGATINDRNKFDLVNNAVVFVSSADVPSGSQLDVLVVQTDEGIANLGNVTAIDIVAQNILNVNTVATNVAKVNTVATNIADVNNVSTNIGDVNAIASDLTKVNTVADNINSVNTTSANIAAVNNVSTHMTDVTNAVQSATDAATSAAAALGSENNAKASENAAAASASAANTAKTAAQTALVNAQAAELAAIQASSDADTAKNAAANSATAAAGSATAAGVSETNAANSASAAAGSLAAVNTSKDAAAASATAAAGSASAASTSASNALGSAAAAASSATAASNSQIAAAASAASAAAAYDTFDDRYLGSKPADPTVDNDGQPLVQGALYFNSSTNGMKVYDGGNWIAASAAGGASLLNYSYTATAGQTTFSGADDNGNTLSYVQKNLIVTLNGVVLEDGTDYTAVDSSSIVLSVAAKVGDELNVVAFKSFTTADMVSSSNGGTFYGPVTVAQLHSDTAITATGAGVFGDDVSVTGDIDATGTITANTFVGNGASLTGIVTIPAGVITMWSGSIASIPSGWVLCDGSNNTPNLMDRFIVGAGSAYTVGTAGGAATVALDGTQIPSHTHSFSGSGNTSNSGNHAHNGSTSSTGAHSHNYQFGAQNGTFVAAGGGSGYEISHSRATSNTGDHSHNFTTAGGGDHSHSFSVSGTTGAAGSGAAHENRPPYYALAYIMKT